jgi:CheY-like chemotaxis protein
LQEQVVHLQKMEAVGRLAGGIAHDFNNMLTAISGFAEMAMQSLPADSPAREDVEQIQRASVRATTLTARLLAFSRKQVLQPRVIDVREAIGDLTPLLERVITGSIVLQTLAEHDPGASARIKVDPGQFEQVVLNLCVNARDAMPDGGTLRIGASLVDLSEDAVAASADRRPGPYAMITVADTGVGMDSATRLRIFEPFFTTKEPGKGTGLGLAMVYGVVTQSGGFIDVQSAPGDGTRFDLYFPATDAPTETTGRISGGHRLPPGTEVGRILVVEDELLVRQLTAAALRGAGYTVLDAEDGPAALSLMAEPGFVKPDLLLTDVMMPGLTGPAVAREVHARWPDLPVLYVTGYADMAELPGGGLRPDADLLHKPFSTQQLLARVSAAIGTPHH